MAAGGACPKHDLAAAAALGRVGPQGGGRRQALGWPRLDIETALRALADAALHPMPKGLHRPADDGRDRADAQLRAAALDLRKLLPLEGVRRVRHGRGRIEQVPEEALPTRRER